MVKTEKVQNDHFWFKIGDFWPKIAISEFTGFIKFL